MANEQKKVETAETTVTPAANLVTVDMTTLAATIASAVAQAMAAQPHQPSTLGEDIAKGIAASTRRKVTFGEYDALGPRNSYHPKSKAETPVLKRNFWQNGAQLNHSTLFDREIELLNRITHSGRYMDRKVEIIYTPEDVHIRYANKSPDQRMELKNFFRSLQELLETVVKEQEAEDVEMREDEEFKRLEREKRTAAKERHFGNNKAYREAVERANAQ
jgi:hypothetical protein